jgi:hypothetical protein
VGVRLHRSATQPRTAELGVVQQTEEPPAYLGAAELRPRLLRSEPDSQRGPNPESLPAVKPRRDRYVPEKSTKYFVNAAQEACSEQRYQARSDSFLALLEGRN